MTPRQAKDYLKLVVKIRVIAEIKAVLRFCAQHMVDAPCEAAYKQYERVWADYCRRTHIDESSAMIDPLMDEVFEELTGLDRKVLHPRQSSVGCRQLMRMIWAET